MRSATVAPAEPIGSSLGMLGTTWALAWPAIISFSLESIVSLCDLLMVGHLGPASVAAVGVGVQILNALNTTLFAIGTGALAIVARHVGAGERRPAEETLRQSIVAAAISSALFALPVAIFARPLVGVPLLRRGRLGRALGALRPGTFAGHVAVRSGHPSGYPHLLWYRRPQASARDRSSSWPSRSSHTRWRPGRSRRASTTASPLHGHTAGSRRRPR